MRLLNVLSGVVVLFTTLGFGHLLHRYLPPPSVMPLTVPLSGRLWLQPGGESLLFHSRMSIAAAGTLPRECNA